MSSFEKIEDNLEKQESKEEKFEHIEKDVENWVVYMMRYIGNITFVFG